MRRAQLEFYSLKGLDIGFNTSRNNWLLIKSESKLIFQLKLRHT